MQMRSNNMLIANIHLGRRLGWSFTSLEGKRPILQGWQSRPRESIEEALACARQGDVGLRTGRISGAAVIAVDGGGDTGAHHPRHLWHPNAVQAGIILQVKHGQMRYRNCVGEMQPNEETLLHQFQAHFR